MKKFISALMVFIFTINAQIAEAQLVNGCGFLQQNRLEIGIANNGAYGTPENAPVGYHPNNNPLFATTYNPVTLSYIQHTNALGFVADWDSNGWAVGTPPYFGDYFLPGTPQEGWSVEVDGVRCDAFSSEYQTNGTTGFTGALTGTNQYVTTVAGVTSSLWSGNFGNLNIKQTTTVKANKLYFTANVKFYNTGGTPLNNVYYMRTLDPDNDVSISGSFTTSNEITYQLPNPGNKSLVGATADVDTNAYLGLGTIDCRSKVFICDFGLFPPSAPDSLAYIFAGHPSLTYSGTTVSDVGIGIVYQLGTIAPGDSTELNFAYILNEASLDEALDAIKPKWLNNSNLYQSNDTIYACQNTNVPVSIVNGNDLNWTWSSGAPLANTTGVNNVVSFGTTPVQVTAYGTGICLDTITFFLAPTDTIYTTISAGICSGNAYVFNGVSYTVGGVYHDTVSTIGGCDSIVTLNLNVGANSSFTMNQSVCQGAGYFFNGNLLNTSGTYYDTLVNSIGCDSLIILNLLIGSTTYGSFTATICQGQSYLFNGVFRTLAGSYNDTLLNSNGCDSILTLNLIVNPNPVASFIYDKAQICNTDNILFTYTGSLDPNNIYTFNPDGGTILSGSGVGPYSVQWATPGVKNVTFQVTLNGCIGAPVSQTITVIEVPSVKVTFDKDICLDATANVEAASVTPGVTYTWTLNTATLVSGNASTAGPLTLSWNTVGPKLVLVQCDNQGCLSNIDSAFINVHELPTANISSLDLKDTYCETDEVHLTTDNITNAFFQWQPLENFIRYDYNNATMILYDTTLVSVLTTNGWGCKAMDTMTIYSIPCKDFFVPNVFSPNGDNLNDVFKVVGLKGNAFVEMMIYNRWGQQMFASSDKNVGWNGYFKGERADNGVYFYHIKITFPTGDTKILKGDLTLIR